MLLQQAKTEYALQMAEKLSKANAGENAEEEKFMLEEFFKCVGKEKKPAKSPAELLAGVASAPEAAAEQKARRDADDSNL